MPPKPWDILAKRPIYRSDWINLYHVDLVMPDGHVINDYHVIEYPYQAAGVIPIGDDGRILLIEQFRFQTKTRGFEVPAGRIDDGETPEQAVVRELREETGYAAKDVRKLGYYHPAVGTSNMTFHLFVATGIHRVGDVVDVNEVISMKWFEPAELRQMILRNQIINGLSLTALLWFFLETSESR